jgi:hypothetical protein
MWSSAARAARAGVERIATGARPPGAPVSGQADASVATEALEGPELDEQDEGSTETDDGAGGNVEDLDRDKSSCGVVHKLRCSPN